MDNPWWLILSLISAASMATTVFLDNYTVDVVFKRKSPMSQKVVYAFLELIAVFLIGIFVPIEKINFESSVLIIISGACYALALIPFYYALKHDDSVVSEIFTQTLPIFNLILGMIFLSEQLAASELISFAIILVAGFITIFAKKKQEKITSAKAAVFMCGAVLLWALADLFFAKITCEVDFATTLFYILIGRSIVDIMFALLRPKERKNCFILFKKGGLKSWSIMIADFAIEICSDIIFRIALPLAPIALVSVVNSAAELIFVFIYGVILTKLWPKFGREKLDRRTILVHLTAVILMLFGIILLG